MPLTVCFIRHVESQANVDQVFANRLDFPSPLTADGVDQAEVLTRILGSAHVTHVYVSPLMRAMQTATQIAEALGVPCLVNDALREYSVGDFEGESLAGDGACVGRATKRWSVPGVKGIIAPAIPVARAWPTLKPGSCHSWNHLPLSTDLPMCLCSSGTADSTARCCRDCWQASRQSTRGFTSLVIAMS